MPQDGSQKGNLPNQSDVTDEELYINSLSQFGSRIVGLPPFYHYFSDKAFHEGAKEEIDIVGAYKNMVAYNFARLQGWKTDDKNFTKMRQAFEDAFNNYFLMGKPVSSKYNVYSKKNNKIEDKIIKSIKE